MSEVPEGIQICRYYLAVHELILGQVYSRILSLISSFYSNITLTLILPPWKTMTESELEDDLEETSTDHTPDGRQIASV